MVKVAPGTLLLLPTTSEVMRIYELVRRLPPYYEVNVTYMVMTAINSMSAVNGGVLELLIDEFIKSIQLNAWNSGNALLDPLHEQELALAIIGFYTFLNELYTKHGLWDGPGISYWNFFRFVNYDMLIKYNGTRQDEVRPCPTEPGSGLGGLSRI